MLQVGDRRAWHGFPVEVTGFAQQHWPHGLQGWVLVQFENGTRRAVRANELLELRRPTTLRALLAEQPPEAAS